MNKREAYEALLNGFTIRNEYYTPDEWLRMENGEIKTEEGYTMHLDDWNRYQDPDETYYWEIIGDGDKFLHANKDLLTGSHDPYIFTTRGPFIDETVHYGSATRKQRQEVVIPVQPSSGINRNDICKCGSSLKFKKCCMYGK